MTRIIQINSEFSPIKVFHSCLYWSLRVMDNNTNIQGWGKKKYIYILGHFQEQLFTFFLMTHQAWSCVYPTKYSLGLMYCHREGSCSLAALSQQTRFGIAFLAVCLPAHHPLIDETKMVGRWIFVQLCDRHFSEKCFTNSDLLPTS